MDIIPVETITLFPLPTDMKECIFNILHDVKFTSKGLYKDVQWNDFDFVYEQFESYPVSQTYISNRVLPKNC